MSDYELSAHQRSLLDKGLTFIPTVCRVPYRRILECKQRNVRNLKLRDYFRFSEREYNADAFENRFKLCSDWTPPISGISEETIKAINRISILSNVVCSKRLIRNDKPGSPFVACRDNSSCNLSQDEICSINELRTNNNIIIKPADKGGAVVVMNKDLYKAEGLRQLLNGHYYEEIQRPLANETANRINAVLCRLLNSGRIDDKQYKFLYSSVPNFQRSFYLLPKIHKPIHKWPNRRMPEGRPIVADCGSETYNVCEFIDYFLKPVATRHASYLKDTYDFISKIRGKPIPRDALLVTGDVTALYTNMDIERSLKVVRETFLNNPDESRPDEEILELLEICLKNNDFYFAGRTFVQKCGTAMGKKFAPNLANLYLLEFDRLACDGFRIKPWYFFRFLDDIFFVWTGTHRELQEFNDYINSILPGIKITLTFKEEIIEFLDTRIYKQHRSNVTALGTRVFFKDTDTHQLLHGRSFHPRHTTRGILKSQLIRFKRISSNKYEYDHACRTLFDVLRKRGYSRSLYRRLKREIWHSNSYNLVRVGPRKPKTIFPIINFYDPIGGKLMRVFRTSIKNLEIFHDTKIIQANRIHKNLGRLLTKSRFEG